MQSIMECPVCSENFDRQVHCPLVLLCGHTLCKACASHLRAQKDGILCPLDRKIDKRQLEQISHSYHILELLEQISQMQTTIRYLKLSPSERMNALRDSATVRLNECRNNLERVQDKIQEANSKTESLTKRIGDFFTSIRTAIDVRQSELEEEVKKYSDDYIETYLEVEKEATICVDEAETKAKLVKDPSFTEMASEDLDVLELTPQRTLPEMPNEEFKMEFIGDLDSNLSYIKSLGRLGKQKVEPPHECDHFTNV
jgi:hypothetical protein